METYDIPVYNSSGETIPGFAVVVPFYADSDSYTSLEDIINGQLVQSVTKFGTSSTGIVFQPLWLVNGPTPLKAGKYGSCTNLRDGGQVLVPSSGTSQASSWGPKAGSWSLWPDYYGFIPLCRSITIETYRGKSSPVGFFKQIESQNVLACKFVDGTFGAGVWVLKSNVSGYTSSHDGDPTALLTLMEANNSGLYLDETGDTKTYSATSDEVSSVVEGGYYPGLWHYVAGRWVIGANKALGKYA